MKHKFLTKIAAVTLGLAMAVGVSVGVASNKRAKPVYADGETDSITISSSSFTGLGSNNYNSGAERTGSATGASNGDTINLGGHYITGNVSNTPSGATAGSKIQCQANNATIYNTSALPGRLVSVTLNQSGTARAFSLYGGNSRLMASDNTAQSQTPAGTKITDVSSTASMTWNIPANSDYTFFAIKKGGSAGYVDSIVVTYELPSGDAPTLESVAISGDMTKTTYTTGENWDPSGLTVTGTYDSGDPADLTNSATFSYYSDSAMTSAVATPNDLNIGANQHIYIKATVSDISNETGYQQTVTINPVTYTVTYHETNKTSGSAPTDNNSYVSGASVTVLGNAGSLARTGYTWSGWSLNENGSGTAYGPTYTTTYTVATSNVNFYPIWVKNQTPLPEAGTITLNGSNPNLGSYGTDVAYEAEEDNTPDSVFGFSCTNVTKATGSNAGNLQFKASSGVLYSTTPLNYLRNVVVSGSNSGDAVVTYGKSQNDGCTSDTIGSDNTYFKVSNSAGNARYWTITVTYSLAEPELTGLRISDGLDSVRKNYDAGESFDPTGLVIQAKWGSEWDTTHNVANAVTWDPDPLTGGTTSVTGTYSAGGNDETVTVTGLNVVAPDYVIDGDSNKPVGVSNETNTTVGEGLSNGIEYCYYALQTYNTNLEFNQNTLGAYLGNNESYGKYISRIKVTLTAAVAFDRLTMYKGDAAVPGTTTVSANTNSGTVRSFNFNNDSEYFALKQTTTGNWNQIVKIEVFLGSNVPVVDSVSASIVSGTYYAGSTLSASDFNVTVSWTEGKADTHPTGGFTWTVNGVANGALSAGDNSVVVSYGGESSAAFNVEAESSSTSDLIRNTIHTNASLTYHYSKSDNFVTDSMDRSFTDISGTAYGDWSGKAGTSGAVYSGNSAGGNDSIQIRKSKDTQAKSGIISTTSGGKISKVTVSWNDGNTDGRVLNIYGKDTAYSSPADLYDSESFGTLLGTIVYGTSTELVVSGDYAYVGIVPTTGAAYLDSVEIDWVGDPSYTYSKVGIRFGGLISTELWTSLNEESPIQGYGVYYSTSTNWSTDLLKDYYPEDDGVDFRDFYTPITNEHQTPTQVGNNYVWNLFKTISEGAIANENLNILETSYTAVAYIKTQAGMVFFQQKVKSAKTLANDLLGTDAYDDDSLEGSLYNLAHLALA